MIHDCFMFFDELDMLEIRLNILGEAVDRFVLVEATTTHSGVPKPLYFEENKRRFAAFHSKIIHVVATDLPVGPRLPDGSERAPANRWPAENAQRDAILRGLAWAAEDDWAVVADVDDIWNPAALPARLDGPVSFLTEVRGAFLNSEVIGHNKNVALCQVGQLRQITPQGLRQGCHGWPTLLGHGGWCFGWIRDSDEAIRTKVAAFAHAEYDNTPGRQYWIDRRREARVVDPATDPTLHPYIKANVERYRHLMRL